VKGPAVEEEEEEEEARERTYLYKAEEMVRNRS
jgi:hypothetical protein